MLVHCELDGCERDCHGQCRGVGNVECIEAFVVVDYPCASEDGSEL